MAGDISLDAFSDGQVPEWTTDQWNQLVATKEFIDTYTDAGVVNINTVIEHLGVQGYLALLEHCQHLVVYQDIIYNSDVPAARKVLEKAMRQGKLPLITLVKAGVIEGDKADDMIQDAITIAQEFLQPNVEWDDKAYRLAMQWSPDQWRESMRYCNFKKHFVHNGIVQLQRLKPANVPPELVERMVERSPNLVQVGDTVYDADNDAGVRHLERALMNHEITLARLIEAEVFTKQEAAKMHKDALSFAAEHLHTSAKWTEAEEQTTSSFIPEQWDAFVDSKEFDSFTEAGFVNVALLKKVMGSKGFGRLLDLSKTLVELGSRVVVSTTAEGKNALLEAANRGDLKLAKLVGARILTASDIEKRCSTAARIATACFKEGAKIDDQSKRDAMSWSTDEWDSAIDAMNFQQRFVREGTIRFDLFPHGMTHELFNQMVRRSSYFIRMGNKAYDMRTSEGRAAVEDGLWTGDVPVYSGVKLGLITRDQQRALYQEARDIAMANFVPDHIWSDHDRDIALVWAKDQWAKALQAVNFSEMFTERGLIHRDRLIVAMGPALFDAMVKHTEAFVALDSMTVYDTSTPEGFAAAQHILSTQPHE